MHSYLRAIGFGNIVSRDDSEKLFQYICDNATKHQMMRYQDIIYTEISKEFMPGVGITLRGETDQNDEFFREHYFPYLKGNNISIREEVGINKKVDCDSYTGMCDDYRLGVSLIFYLQNVLDFYDKKERGRDLTAAFPVSLSALSLYGKVLLPVDKDQELLEKKHADTKYRSKLIAEAKKGNQDAIDSLTIDDIDTFAMISRRIRTEDVYSIVDTTFVPYGSESDNYSILGNIIDSECIVNPYTKEEIYIIELLCNEIPFRICINKEDLFGEPAPGRRFKGTIWMQGRVLFDA